MMGQREISCHLRRAIGEMDLRSLRVKNKGGLSKISITNKHSSPIFKYASGFFSKKKVLFQLYLYCLQVEQDTLRRKNKEILLKICLCHHTFCALLKSVCVC